MRHLKILFLLIVVLVLAGIVLDAGEIRADMKKGLSIKKTTPAPPPEPTPHRPSIQGKKAPLKPMRDVLAISHVSLPSLCVRIPKAFDDLKPLENQLSAATPVTCSLPVTNFAHVNYAKKSVRECCAPERSFSVQEQQAAGCAGSDTVAQCMDKLTKQCIRNKGAQDHIREGLKGTQEVLEELSTATGKVADQLEDMLTIIP